MTHSYDLAGAPAHDFRLAKVLGVLAVTASAVAAEYGAGINFVSTQSLGVYPGVHGLVPLAMFVTGILMLPKTYLFVMFSRVMPRAGSKYVWIARSLGVPVGFLVTFLWWATGPAGAGVLAFAFGTFLGQAVLGFSPALGAALLSPAGISLCGLAAIWVTYAVNAAGVHRYGLFVTVLLFVIVAVALVICAIGFSTSQAAFVAAASRVAKVPLAAPAVAPADNYFDFVAVCSLFVFAYAGLGAGPALGGEVDDARRKLPRGIAYGFVVALVLFTAVALGPVSRSALVGDHRPDQGRQGELRHRPRAGWAGRAELAERAVELRRGGDRRQDLGARLHGVLAFRLCLWPGPDAAGHLRRDLETQGAARRA